MKVNTCFHVALYKNLTTPRYLFYLFERISEKHLAFQFYFPKYMHSIYDKQMYAIITERGEKEHYMIKSLINHDIDEVN